ncbi:Multidrug resistance protein fnx1 [Botrytis cinerea]
MASSNRLDEETPLLADTTIFPSQSPPSESAVQDPSTSEATIIPNEPSTKRLVVTLGAIWVGVFLGALDSTIIATLSASISTSFNSLSLLSWLASAYLIANAACQPLSGRLTDIFSRRTGLIERAWEGSLEAGSMILGDGEWLFLAQVPFIIVSGILVACLVNIPSKESKKSKLSRVDFMGSFALVLTLVLLLLGLNSGGNIVPWNHPLVYVSLPLSLVSLLGFIYIELYIASEPVIPVRLLANRTVFAACLTNWFVTMVVFMIIFYVPLYYQVRGESTTASGLRLIPQSIGASIGSLGSGIIMNRTGKYKSISLITLAMLVIGTGLLATLDSNSPDWPIYIYLALTGIGYGATLTTTLLAIISAVSHDHHSVITSASYAFRSTGSTIGITIASAVYQNILKSDLWEKFGDRPDAEEIIGRIRDSFEELNKLPDGWRDGVMESFMDAFRGVFLTALGFAVLMAGVGSMMKQNVLHDRLDRS